MTLISLRLMSNPFHYYKLTLTVKSFHSHALLCHCTLYAVFKRMNKICLKQRRASINYGTTLEEYRLHHYLTKTVLRVVEQ